MDPNKLFYFPWYPDAFFPSVAFSLLAPFLKKLAPKKDLQGPLWPSSKIFWLKHQWRPLESSQNEERIHLLSKNTI